MSKKPNTFRNRNRGGKPHNKDPVEVDNSNPMMVEFKEYSNELDDKYDRYERIVKVSRDITIESKRVIFLLHTIDPLKSNKSSVLEKAKARLEEVISKKFLEIAKELENLDPYQYLRAYCFALQEFVEAYSYYEYLEGSSLSDWNILQDKMRFSINSDPIPGDASAEPQVKTLSCFVDPNEYILGLGDLTGELMRRCINSLGCGDTHTCKECCHILQLFYKEYLTLHSNRARDLAKKINTLHQSVLKVENVCYNVKVRGGEAAQRGILGHDKPEDLDEGFF